MNTDNVQMDSEPAPTAPVIKRPRACGKCGYNLYSLPREGACPECGEAYKSRKDDGKPKNPNRQLGQYRRILRKCEREKRWLPAWWAFALCALCACYFFELGRGCWVAAGFITLMAAGHNASVLINLSDIRTKIEAIDRKPIGSEEND